jgi:hypothetical protein
MCHAPSQYRNNYNDINNKRVVPFGEVTQSEGLLIINVISYSYNKRDLEIEKSAPTRTARAAYITPCVQQNKKNRMPPTYLLRTIKIKNNYNNKPVVVVGR